MTEVKNLKEKKNSLITRKTTQRENHHFKGITHTTLFIITIIISTHKNETDFREKEEKSRRRSIRSRIERRAEK